MVKELLVYDVPSEDLEFTVESRAAIPDLKAEKVDIFFSKNGFYVARGLVSQFLLEKIEARCLAIISAYTQSVFAGLQDPSLISLIASDQDLEQHLSRQIEKCPELSELCLSDELSSKIAEILSSNTVVVVGDMPFRIDCPLVKREPVTWHQDQHNVGRSPGSVTAWIPLFDVSYKDGCLLIVPGSHKEGDPDPDAQVLNEKHYPSEIFGRTVRHVEMQRGDVLFFDTRLLHASGNNLGETIRYSVQSQYQEARVEIDPAIEQQLPIGMTMQASGSGAREPKDLPPALVFRTEPVK